MRSAGGSQIGAHAPSSLDSPLIPQLSPQPCAPPTVKLERGAFSPRLSEHTSGIEQLQGSTYLIYCEGCNGQAAQAPLNIPVDTVSDWRVARYSRGCGAGEYRGAQGCNGVNTAGQLQLRLASARARSAPRRGWAR